jgi:hypothetical protein
LIKQKAATKPSWKKTKESLVPYQLAQNRNKDQWTWSNLSLTMYLILNCFNVPIKNLQSFSNISLIKNSDIIYRKHFFFNFLNYKIKSIRFFIIIYILIYRNKYNNGKNFRTASFYFVICCFVVVLLSKKKKKELTHHLLVEQLAIECTYVAIGKYMCVNAYYIQFKWSLEMRMFYELWMRSLVGQHTCKFSICRHCYCFFLRLLSNNLGKATREAFKAFVS